MKTPNKRLQLLHHHAHCIFGTEKIASKIIAELETIHGISNKGNEDFLMRKYETLSISDAKEIRGIHDMKPTHNSGKKIFILTVDNITVEAQNALLKLLEEPAEYAHFFIIVSSLHILIPTLRSRLSMLELDTNADISTVEGDMHDEAQAFLKMNMAKKIEYIKKFTDDIAKETRTKNDAIQFLNALEKNIYNDKGIKNGANSLEAIMFARKYMYDRSPSVKMLLEYVALNI